MVGFVSSRALKKASLTMWERVSEYLMGLLWVSCTSSDLGLHVIKVSADLFGKKL